MELSVEAKREYLNMICQAMSPIMSETFVNMYKEAITRSNRHRDQVIKLFIVLLEEITNWNNSIIMTHTKEYETQCPYFTDLLAAVFVCYIKILSSIKITKDSKKLSIKLPTNADFIHACLMNAAKLFMQNPTMFREENQTMRDDSIRSVCCKAIEKTLNDLIPIQQILRTYITDTSKFDIGEDPTDPDEHPFEPEAEEIPQETQEQEPEEQVEPDVPQTQPEPEKKNIPVFFDDAGEEKKTFAHKVNETSA